MAMSRCAGGSRQERLEFRCGVSGLRLGWKALGRMEEFGLFTVTDVCVWGLSNQRGLGEGRGSYGGVSSLDHVYQCLGDLVSMQILTWGGV